MPVLHQLCLPLPDAYAQSQREGYSFFSPQSNGPDSAEANTSMETVDRYLDDICHFLARTRLVQRHPDKFFDYMQGAAWQQGARHLDGTPVTAEEVAETVQWCQAFVPLMPSDTLGELRDLVLHGPPTASGSAELHEFYQTTRRLMLVRQRRPGNDAASWTLTCDADERERVRAMPPEQEKRRRQRVADLVLSYGMNPKKQHEVSVMRETMSDLISCCGVTPSVASDAPRERVTTIVNVGEGKGYVSRTLALCEGLQVVGLDCNPAHKEGATGRLDNIIELSLATATVTRSVQGGPKLLNLLYEPRGHVSSVACRVEKTGMDWAALLQPHVPLLLDDDDDGSDTRGTPSPVAAHTRAAASAHTDVSEECLPSEMTARPVKGRCRLCGCVICIEGTLVQAMRHIQRHLHSPAPFTTVASGGLLSASREDIERWNLELSQEEYTSRVVNTFLDTALVLPSNTAEAAGGDAGAETEPSPTTDAHTDVSGTMDAMFEPVHVRRGLRVVLRIPVAVPSSGGGTTQQLYEYRTETATILGYDEGSQQHRVLREMDSDRRGGGGGGTSRKAAFYLFRWARAAKDSVAPAPAPAPLSLPPASEWLRARRVLVERVEQPLLPRPEPVAVPSLRNTVMIGLHTCGDLGSAVCQLFARSDAQGLLLVSCCWHALTEEGFPLSRALQRRGMTTDHLGLLLATQPLDMWTTDSAEGHRSSAKLLFFRSLLKVFWKKAAEGWQEGRGRESGAEGTCQRCDAEGDSAVPFTACSFAPLPHLEPTFLRRINHKKAHMTFMEFVSDVLAYYINADTAVVSAYTWQTCVCPVCRAQQEQYFTRVVQKERLAEQLETMHFAAHFRSFLGLTVLRMWCCHLVETVLLLDRTLYLAEQMQCPSAALAGDSGDARDGYRKRVKTDTKAPVPTHRNSCVSLAPLFDGAISPRMYGIMVRRW